MRPHHLFTIITVLLFVSMPGAAAYNGITFERVEKDVGVFYENLSNTDKRVFSVHGTLTTELPWIRNRAANTYIPVRVETTKEGDATNWTLNDVTIALQDKTGTVITEETDTLDQVLNASETSAWVVANLSVSDASRIHRIGFTLDYDLTRSNGVTTAYVDTAVWNVSMFHQEQNLTRFTVTPSRVGRGTTVNLSGQLSFWKENASITLNGETTRPIQENGAFTLPYTVPRTITNGEHVFTVNLSTPTANRIPASFTVSVEGDAPHITGFTAPNTVTAGKTMQLRFTAEDRQTPRTDLTGWFVVDGERFDAAYRNGSFTADITVTENGTVTVHGAVEDEDGRITTTAEKTVTVKQSPEKEADAASSDKTGENGETTGNTLVDQVLSLRGTTTLHIALLVFAICIVAGFYLYFSTTSDQLVDEEPTETVDTEETGEGYFAEQQALQEEVEDEEDDT